MDLQVADVIDFIRCVYQSQQQAIRRATRLDGGTIDGKACTGHVGKITCIPRSSIPFIKSTHAISH
ncbi:Uncharacterized protein APZ42_027326 [Daphnia magna]|uniref:Uncharacterized protein n=1 Tax=Daphnia magna TaxID=35525 RepID=A0A164RH01_9CRUS|nr:Uncharacterized protein APZ42_027326 [Daphnia magna]